jgi:hypothetical protein
MPSTSSLVSTSSWSSAFPGSMRDFIAFEDEGGGRLVKKMA